MISRCSKIELPIRIMGSGAELNSEYVDQDLMSGDRDLMKKLKIDQMKLGDLIAINHADHRWEDLIKKIILVLLFAFMETL